MRPVKRDFASAPMASTTGVPRSMPTSAVSSAEKMPACVAGIRPSATFSPLTNSVPVPPLPGRRRRRRTRSGVPPCRRRAFWSTPTDVSLQAEEVVVVGRHAVLDVERPAAEAPALGDDGAVAAAGRHLDLGGDGLGPVLHVDEDALHHAGHAFGERQRRAPAHEVGPPDEPSASSRSKTRSSIGSTPYFAASFRNSACSSASFSGFCAARSLARLKSERTS